MATARIYFSTFIEMDIPDDMDYNEAVGYANMNAYDIAMVGENREELVNNIALQETETEIF